LNRGTTVPPGPDQGQVEINTAFAHREHRGRMSQHSRRRLSRARSRETRSKLRSSGVVPPQIPSGSPAVTAQARQSSRTRQPAHMRFAAAICASAGPTWPTGKNSSGSTHAGRQAARSVQCAPDGRGSARKVREPAVAVTVASGGIVGCSSRLPARRRFMSPYDILSRARRDPSHRDPLPGRATERVGPGRQRSVRLSIPQSRAGDYRTRSHSRRCAGERLHRR
jgi:hypothetical protein